MQNNPATESIDRVRRRIQPGLIIKPVVFFLCLVPLVALVFALFTDRLGANPIESLSRETGEWTLRFLLIGLLATPLQQQFRWLWAARIRRMIGLFAFFYACVHMLVFVWLDQQMDWSLIATETIEKPYLLAGMLALLVLLPLALTSNDKTMRNLGRRWQSLHRWVYIAVLAGCLHFVWLAKGDKPEPLVYLTIFIVLLLWRFGKLLKK